MNERDTSTPLYGIAVAAELADLAGSTLRLYEKHGLLHPLRSDGGTRRYSEDDLTRLRRVTALREAGVNLAGIGKVLDLQDQNVGLQVENDALRDENAELRRALEDGSV